MIQEIGEILHEKYKDRPWVDRSAGIVITGKIESEGKGGQTIIERFPVACNFDPNTCEDTSTYKMLVPDTSKKSVVYIEEDGIQYGDRKGDSFTFTADLVLVAWVNVPQLDPAFKVVSGALIIDLLRNVSESPFNDAARGFQNIRFKFLGQIAKNENIFRRYSYKQEVLQHLLFPADYFGLRIQATWQMHKDCVGDFALQAPDDCKNF